MRDILCYILIVLLVTTSCQHRKADHDVIALQPYKNFKRELLDTLSKTIAEYYNAQVVILPSIALPKEAFIHIKSPRYRADKLIRILEETKSDSVDYILGLTTEDISTTKRNTLGQIKEPASRYEDWGVFGLGYMPGESCVVSTYRLSTPKTKTIERLKKICIHELGHTMGLDHCETIGCVMADAAEKIKTIDQVHLSLCQSCKKKINLE